MSYRYAYYINVFVYWFFICAKDVGWFHLVDWSPQNGSIFIIFFFASWLLTKNEKKENQWPHMFGNLFIYLSSIWLSIYLSTNLSNLWRSASNPGFCTCLSTLVLYHWPVSPVLGNSWIVYFLMMSASSFCIPISILEASLQGAGSSLQICVFFKSWF
jgi:hypothetical protein